MLRQALLGLRSRDASIELPVLQSLDLARLDELVGEDSGTPMVRELIDLFINDSPA